MQMAEGLDTGDMLHILKTRITPEETAETLHDRLSLLAAETLRETILLLEQKQLKPVQQPEEGVTYAEKITKEMSRLDFNEPAEVIDRMIRAVTGAAMCGERRIKLLGSVLTGSHSDAPAGTVLEAKKHILLSCGDGGVIELTRLQAEGGKALPARDFLNGFPLHAGDLFTALN